MPDTKNANETVDTGNPGKPANKDADRSAGGSRDMGQNQGQHQGQKNAGDSADQTHDDKASKSRKPGEKDAPHVPDSAKPSFE